MSEEEFEVSGEIFNIFWSSICGSHKWLVRENGELVEWVHPGLFGELKEREE